MATMTENARNLKNLFQVENVSNDKILDRDFAAEPFIKPVLHDSNAHNKKASRQTRFDESVFVIHRENSTQEDVLKLTEGLNNASYQKELSDTEAEGANESETTESFTTSSSTVKPGVSAAEVVTFFLDKLSRNKGQIRLNCFLFVLLGLIITAILVFVIVKPEKLDTYEMPLSHYATFWPLKRRLSVAHSSSSPPLELMWGYHVPESSQGVPSFCSKRGALDCTKGDCCLRYPGHSRLYLNSFTFASANCVRLNWMREKPIPDELFYFTDCIFTQGRDWYGGLLELNVSWPIRWLNSSEFRLVLTGHDNGVGVVEPFWMSGDGYSIRVDSSGPLLWNYTQEYFCLKSLNAFNYTICEAENLSDLYLTARKNDRPFTNASNDRLKRFLGTTFFSLNSTEVSKSSNESSKDLSQKVKYLWNNLPPNFGGTFVLGFEDNCIFRNSHTEKTVEFIQGLKKEISRLKVSVEINNYVSLEEVERNPGIWDKLIWQEAFEQTPKSTGLVLWRNRLCEVVDISQVNTSEWFLHVIKQWPLFSATQYVTVTGGYASLLPAVPDVNVSHGNGNFYTSKYVMVASNLSKAVLISSGFQSQSDPLYTTVAARCDNVKSVIPLALSLSILGYAHLALDLQLTKNQSCDMSTLRHLLELSMFFPVAKIPIEIFLPQTTNETVLTESAGFKLFEETFSQFSSVRDNYTYPHYFQAMEEFRQHKTPIIRPMWWTEESLTQRKAETLTIDDQFMIGSNMFIKAFLGYPNVQNTVYFPKGTWFDPLWNGGYIRVPEGQNIAYASKTPLSCFVRVTEER